MKLDGSTTDPVALLEELLPDTPDTNPATPDDGSHHEDEDDLIQVIVNLTRRAYDALERAHRLTGETRTDTINRALVVYDLVQQLAARRGGGSIRMATAHGRRRRIRVT